MLGGIDIGGTKIGVCVGGHDGVVLASDRLETQPHHDGPQQLRAALERMRALASDAGGSIERMGVSTPGPYDRRSRTLLEPPNMPGWHGLELGAFFDAESDVPVRIMNDANAASMAEWQWGGHGMVSTLAFLTMSTGFGAGIVVEGVPLEGRHGFAGEVGRIVLSEFGPVGFGAMGTVEGFLSGPGMTQLAHAEALRCRQSGEPTALLGDEVLSPEVLCRHAKTGDPGAVRVTTTVAHKLGELVAILGNVLEPDAVVLGTIGAAAPELFIPPAMEVVRDRCVSQTASRLQLVPSTLQDRGNAAALAAATLES
ncbi:MAG: ROK family protein [Planctomycetota bacterium]